MLRRNPTSPQLAVMWLLALLVSGCTQNPAQSNQTGSVANAGRNWDSDTDAAALETEQRLSLADLEPEQLRAHIFQHLYSFMNSFYAAAYGVQDTSDGAEIGAITSDDEGRVYIDLSKIEEREKLADILQQNMSVHLLLFQNFEDADESARVDYLEYYTRHWLILMRAILYGELPAIEHPFAESIANADPVAVGLFFNDVIITSLEEADYAGEEIDVVLENQLFIYLTGLVKNFGARSANDDALMGELALQIGSTTDVVAWLTDNQQQQLDTEQLLLTGIQAMAAAWIQFEAEFRSGSLAGLKLEDALLDVRRLGNGREYRLYEPDTSDGLSLIGARSIRSAASEIQRRVKRPLPDISSWLLPRRARKPDAGNPARSTPDSQRLAQQRTQVATRREVPAGRNLQASMKAHGKNAVLRKQHSSAKPLPKPPAKPLPATPKSPDIAPPVDQPLRQVRQRIPQRPKKPLPPKPPVAGAAPGSLLDVASLKPAPSKKPPSTNRQASAPSRTEDSALDIVPAQPVSPHFKTKTTPPRAPEPDIPAQAKRTPEEIEQAAQVRRLKRQGRTLQKDLDHIADQTRTSFSAPASYSPADVQRFVKYVEDMRTLTKYMEQSSFLGNIEKLKKMRQDLRRGKEVDTAEMNRLLKDVREQVPDVVKKRDELSASAPSAGSPVASSVIDVKPPEPPAPPPPPPPPALRANRSLSPAPPPRALNRDLQQQIADGVVLKRTESEPRPPAAASGFMNLNNSPVLERALRRGQEVERKPEVDSDADWDL